MYVVSLTDCVFVCALNCLCGRVCVVYVCQRLYAVAYVFACLFA